MKKIHDGKQCEQILGAATRAGRDMHQCKGEAVARLGTAYCARCKVRLLRKYPYMAKEFKVLSIEVRG